MSKKCLKEINKRLVELDNEILITADWLNELEIEQSELKIERHKLLKVKK